MLPHRREILAAGRPLDLGERAFDVLMALIEPSGAILEPIGIVTETRFEGMARQGRLPAWISSPTADIASRRRSSSTRSGFISDLP
jgi:hypothetical protein